MQIDLNKYMQFIIATTSKESTDLAAFMNRLDQLDGNYEAYGPNGEMQHGPDVNIPLLITSVMGLSAEAGEAMEIVKKMLFQGKPLTKENHHHLVREAGDCFWYLMNLCRALGLEPNDVIAENVNKLKARYPGGDFDPYYSENRQAGDI